MANADHIAQLRQGAASWNIWRRDAGVEHPDLTRADLTAADLSGANLIETSLGGANLGSANLSGANLRSAYLGGANLRGANLSGADLSTAVLRRADLSGANLGLTPLYGPDVLANLSGPEASIPGANLLLANLDSANLSGAKLMGANLMGANLSGANLSGANLSAAILVKTRLEGADLTGCRIYGVSAWGVKLDNAKQQDLILTPADEPEITVDDVEVAQFVYLLLHNEKIGKVIDRIASKAVLILGRFTNKRKTVLDALREELRKRHYLPILFDFSVPATRDITETVSLLARMARFIIADLTDPSSIPKELEAIVPHLAVPVQSLLEGSSRPYAMFKDYWKYEWVLPPYHYEGLKPLLATLAECVIAPAEAKVKVLEERRRKVEAELTKASS
jgi:uncharacterized protein YjbI with pentapeptide repeats